jgi:hypothetical protein
MSCGPSGVTREVHSDLYFIFEHASSTLACSPAAVRDPAAGSVALEKLCELLCVHKDGLAVSVIEGIRRGFGKIRARGLEHQRRSIC